ncbi:alpha-ketoglutarate-dependent dioxygenase AlkB [Escherichia coli SHECO001]|nr:alpha-ketoglutarate-dependent dioxygenase AlkB [Escherichia coli SHECO001]
MLDLFADAEPWQEPLAAGAVILHRFAFNAAEQLIRDINDVASQSPFRQMVTPGGYTMSVAMTNCGHLGWTTHRQGYLYSPIDPQTNKPWPAMPQSFHDLCQRAATAAGYPDFQPDACLIQPLRSKKKKTNNRGPPCHKAFMIYVNVRLRRRAIRISSQMLVLSTATLLARNCRCIRIKTNRICARRLFLFLLAYPRFFNLVA